MVSYPAVTFSTEEDDANNSNTKNDNEQDNEIHWKKGGGNTPAQQKSEYTIHVFLHRF